VKRALLVVLAVGTLVGCKHRHSHARKAPPIDLAMVRIPLGRFEMGSNEGDRDERPIHDVTVDTFQIQRTLVSVAEYRLCEAKGACTATPEKPYCNEHLEGREAHPINCATWRQARDFCAWAMARLPTEAEWEYAARGKDGRRYPWGNERPARQLCWDGKTSDLGMMKRRSTCEVDAHPSGASPFGLFDMAGNVWQWTSDLASYDYDGRRTGPKRITRGGTWYAYDGQDVRATLRFPEREDVEDYGTGFRCAR
jgi:formylglycine-generating enzyme required for sulfatase activity